MADRFKVGDVVITQSPLWWQNENVGDRLGKVISTEGHIMVELYDFHNNPIKCFRSELRIARFGKTIEEEKDVDWFTVMDRDDI